MVIFREEVKYDEQIYEAPDFPNPFPFSNVGSVAVFMGREMIGSGEIVQITDFVVKIGDEFYVRENCTFKYAS
ncbi:hypothetical protein [Paenibacillus sp. GCM10027626]|uniref:hypothetical protein n=1 Tax=Paenibacillus sp. GCM10027626 TaxID=3273411 RepID=UPI003637E089